ncbi:alpha/beta fold hydrolase [Paenibacillus sp. GCM10012306]|uniref:alpha/beta fold hydrolase n=1 Tax=Paenibacillus sp. GCM10012306 TaxID=3317342 RepID=UPI00360D7702
MTVTQTDVVKTRNGSIAKKIGKISLIVIGGIIAAVILFLAITFIADKISTKAEEKKLENAYGQLVPVDGKKMNVYIEGSGDETIVLLPGYGTAGPALDFKPLIAELSPHYKVVAVEPFGYGLSDPTDKERTTDNIVSEIHEALQQLGINRFILMGHSITGIYGLDYVNKYPNEVTAFAGIDTSVPTQGGMDTKLPIQGFKFLNKSGLLRLILKVGSDPYASLGYDEHTRELLKMLSNRNSNEDTTLNELKNLYDNFVGARKLSFPPNLPLILFVAANNTGVKDWIPLHEEQIKQSEHGKLVKLEGDHYLHHTQSKAIAENFRAFMTEMK